MARYWLKRAEPRTEADRSRVAETVTGIIRAVAAEGDAAVARYALTFDRWDNPMFRVSDDRIRDIERTLPQTSDEASRRVAPGLGRLCHVEGMLAHEKTADIRFERYAPRNTGARAAD